MLLVIVDFMGKTNDKLEFLYIIASVLKSVIFALKCTFLGKNRLNTKIELKVALIEIANCVTLVRHMYTKNSVLPFHTGKYTVFQNAWSCLVIGFDIWLLKTGQLCLIFIKKGQFLLKKIIQGHKGQKGQWRPTKASKVQNFKFLFYYHYSM